MYYEGITREARPTNRACAVARACTTGLLPRSRRMSRSVPGRCCALPHPKSTQRSASARRQLISFHFLSARLIGSSGSRPRPPRGFLVLVSPRAVAPTPTAVLHLLPAPQQTSGGRVQISASSSAGSPPRAQLCWLRAIGSTSTRVLKLRLLCPLRTIWTKKMLLSCCNVIAVTAKYYSTTFFQAT